MARLKVMRRGSIPRGVALLNVVVHRRADQVVGRGDGVHVAGEVEVDVLHRHHLGIAAPGGPALHPEHRAQRGFPQGDDAVFAQLLHGLAQPYGGGGLSLPRGGGVDGGHQHQLAVGPVAQPVDQGLAQLGLVVAVGLQLLLLDAQFPG